MNNGTTHGIESSDAGIQVELTAEIHQALDQYKVSGAQHGTSGNNSDRLRAIASKTRTTKANVATALQMISWGLQVNDYGNALLDDNGNFIKQKNAGVSESMWEQMTAYAKSKGLKGGDYKKLNLPFENKLLAQPKEIRERMAKAVEAFVYTLLTTVFNAQNTAPIVMDAILARKSHDPGPKAQKIEPEKNWTREKIIENALKISSDKGPKGNFED